MTIGIVPHLLPPTPSIGRIVTLKGILANGSDEHPAIITRVWPQTVEGVRVLWWSVNLTVFPDVGAPYCETSVHLLADREAWQAFMDMPTNPSLFAAFWPDRV